MKGQGISSKEYSGGYVGLLALLIGVAIMTFLIIRSFDTLNRQPNGENATEGGFDAIDAARDAKNIIEQRSRDAAQQ